LKVFHFAQPMHI